MDRETEKNLPRLLGLWKQIAARYRDKPGRLFFEALNEPHDKLTDEIWNDMFPHVLKVIRESNPDRAVIVGPGHWNNLHSLEKLALPEDDWRLIVTFHYYEPFHFTHQGAEWTPESDKWKGLTWTATEKQQEDLRRDFETMTTTSSSGTVQFDPLAGRIVSSKEVTGMTGELSVEIGGMTLPLVNAEEHRTTVQLLDKLPE